MTSIATLDEAAIPEDHKIQTDRQARVSFGGACQVTVGHHLGSSPARGVISMIRNSPVGGAAEPGKPTKGAISGISDVGCSPQKQGSTVSGVLQQQQESVAGHDSVGSSRRSANPSTTVARKHANVADSLFIDTNYKALCRMQGLSRGDRMNSWCKRVSFAGCPFTDQRKALILAENKNSRKARYQNRPC